MVQWLENEGTREQKQAGMDGTSNLYPTVDKQTRLELRAGPPIVESQVRPVKF